MRWVIVVPGALVPAPVAAEVARSARVPRLAQRLLRARPVDEPPTAPPGSGAPHLDWLARAFGVPGARPATAAYAWQALSPGEPPAAADAVGRLWLCDPVHFALMRDHLLLASLAEAPLAADDADALARVAAATATGHGAALLRRADQWFLALDASWNIDALPLAAAAGRPIQDRLPSGPDAPRWRRLLTEIQMQWHEHPVNLRRLERDEPAVNGLWLHGGGAAAVLPRGPFGAALLHDAALRGWAHAGGAVLASDPPAAAATAARAGGDLIEDWSELSAPGLAEHWGLWLEHLVAFEAALEERCALAFGAGFASVDLVLAGAEATRRVRIAPADRWRPWRRHALATMLADPAAA